jgi:hypothetical protein
MSRERFEFVGAFCALALGAGSVGGCSSAGLGANEDLASRQDPIYGGTLDTTHAAVMALLRLDNASLGACSGTTIAKQAGSGILLTAAHCVHAIDANDQVVVPLRVLSPSSMIVLPGTDWKTSYETSKVYYVAKVSVHPLYDGSTQSPFDLALVRYLGATVATPVIPPLSLAEDQLVVGSPFTLVGYGKTETNANNSQRREVSKVVYSLTARQILYDQKDGKGGCQGDSGGPALVQSPGGERVAAVTSYGDLDCLTSGVSVRVSSAYSFIQGVVGAIPSVLSCDDCRTASIGADDKCSAAWAPCTTEGSPCTRFIACANLCQDSACYDACVAKNPTGAQVSDALIECQCSTACPQECANDRSCGTPACGGLTVSGALCTSCIQQNCCHEAELCGADAACSACFRHTGTQCDNDSLYNGFLGCLSRCNANPCKVAAGSGADAGAKLDGGTGVVAPTAPAPNSDADVPIQYQAASPAVAASEGGCSCRQTRSNGRDLGRALTASCLVAIAAMRVRSRGRTSRRRLNSAR